MKATQVAATITTVAPALRAAAIGGDGIIAAQVTTELTLRTEQSVLAVAPSEASCRFMH